MFEKVNIYQQLLRQKRRNQGEGDHLLNEANRILKEDLFTEKKILQHLTAYNHSNEVLDEEVLEGDTVFTLKEIKHICIKYRLKCLDSQWYKQEIPYEAIAKIKYLNENYHKELKYFKILGTHDSFLKDTREELYLLARTNCDNYYIIHQWGEKLKWSRKLKYWPLRHFENLFVAVAIVTLVITMSLPSALITLDNRIGYWSGFRAAAYFHLLIFNIGVTAYVTFAFNKNFSSSMWNQARDFD